jgi:hypothetical protein
MEGDYTGNWVKKMAIFATVITNARKSCRFKSIIGQA